MDPIQKFRCGMALLALAAVSPLAADAQSSNGPPHVTMVSPASSQVFPAGINILLGANASDDGRVLSLEFFAGQSKIGDAYGPLTTPAGAWLLTWTNPPTGTYFVTARATDDHGNVGTSAPLQLTFRSDPPPVIDGVEREGNSIRFHLTGPQLYDYTVEFTDSLSAPVWSPLVSYRAKVGPIDVVVTNSVTNAEARFFRVRQDFCYCRSE